MAPQPKTTTAMCSDPWRSSLRMSRADYQLLLDELDRESTRRQKRVFTRFRFEHALIAVRLHQPGGATSEFLGACRNISRGGLSLLHTAYVHNNTASTVAIPDRWGGIVSVSGRAVRCRHVRGSIHEIGITFDTEVDLNKVLPINPLLGQFSMDHVQPESLRGPALLLTSDDLLAGIIQGYCEPTGVTLQRVKDLEACIADGKREYTLVIAAIGVQTNGPIETVAALREADIVHPIILIGGGLNARHRAELVRMPPIACLEVPLDYQQLYRAIGEYLLLDRDTAPDSGVNCLLEADSPLRRLAHDFVKELRSAAGELRGSSGPDAPPRVAALLDQLRCKAKPLGFPSIDAAASQALDVLRATGSVAESRVALEALAGLCERARAA